jgi:hypothetical protein
MSEAGGQVTGTAGEDDTISWCLERCLSTR